MAEPAKGGARVWVVDDDRAVRFVLATALREAGHEVTAFDSAQAALDALRHNVPALIFVHGKVSFGHIAAGYAGMLLLGATTLAIGTFASSLTENPFFAVILSFVFVVLLELAWPVGQIADPPLQELLSYAALHTKHFHSFQRGLVKLSDVVFYLSLIYLSLLAATKVLQNRRFR